MNLKHRNENVGASKHYPEVTVSHISLKQETAAGTENPRRRMGHEDEGRDLSASGSRCRESDSS